MTAPPVKLSLFPGSRKDTAAATNPNAASVVRFASILFLVLVSFTLGWTMHSSKDRPSSPSIRWLDNTQPEEPSPPLRYEDVIAETPYPGALVDPSPPPALTADDGDDPAGAQLIVSAVSTKRAATPASPPSPSAALALADVLKDPLKDCPAAWVASLQKYAKWHREQLALMRARSPAAAPVLAYRCYETPDDTLVVGDDCGGYADRLVGMVHLMIYAMLHKFVFLVDWAVLTEQIAPQVFHSPMINWTYDAALVEYGNRSIDPGEHHFMGCPDHQGPCPLQLSTPPRKLFSYDVTRTRVNKGVVRYSSDEVRKRIFGELGLEPKNCGGCLLRAVAWPNARVVAKFRAHALSLIDPEGPRSVALHIRTGDKPMHQLLPRPEQYTLDGQFWACAQKQVQALAERSKTGARIFFLCDDVRFKREAVARLGADAVMTTEIQPWHISKMQVRAGGWFLRHFYRRSFSAITRPLHNCV